MPDHLSQISPLTLNDVSRFDKRNHLFDINGSKWNESMQCALSDILTSSDKKWDNIVDVCAGALGVFNIIHDKARHIQINDLDEENVNLYNVVKKCPQQFIDTLHLVLDDHANWEANFTAIRDQEYPKWKDHVFDENQPEVDAAACLLILTRLSVRTKKGSFKDKMGVNSMKQVYTAVSTMSQWLQDVIITKQDMFDVLDEYQYADRDTLIICDPPYIDSLGYKSGTFNLDQHKKLSEALLKIRSTYINRHFITYCRVNCHLDSNANQVSWPYLATIDYLYADRGLYYTDVALEGNALERIITSFPFDGAVDYKI